MVVIFENNDFTDWLTAVGTVGSLAIALFGPFIWRRWHAPRLEFAFEGGKPYERLTPMVVRRPGGGGGFGVAGWTRVLVRNVGKTTARQTRVKLIEIRDARGAVLVDKDPLLMRWSAMPTSREMDAIDLGPTDMQFVDILWWSTGTDRPELASYRTDDFAPGFDLGLDVRQTYFLLLSATCDDTHARICLEVYVETGGSVLVRPATEGEWRPTLSVADDEA